MAVVPLRAQSAASFPHVSAEKLDKTRATLPDNFAGQVNIVTLFFKRDQQEGADTWAAAITRIEAAHPQVKSYTLPVFERENILSRWWTNASMRSTTKAQNWPTTIPLYIKRSTFLGDLHLESRDAPAVLVVDHQGRVLWDTRGTATPSREAALTAAVLAALPKK
jgi:hypothetical protein